MRVKTFLPTALHGMCIGATLFLAGFVAWEKMRDCDDGLQQAMQAALATGAQETRVINQDLENSINKQFSAYANDRNKDFSRRAKTIVAKADSMFMLLDSLSQKPDAELLYFVQGRLQTFRAEAWAAADFNKEVDAAMPYFSPADWLFQSWENGSRQAFATTLMEAKAIVATLACVALNYCCAQVSNDTGLIFTTREPLFAIEQRTLIAGDSVIADVALGEYSFSHFYEPLVLRLNGQGLPVKYGTAPFQVRFDKPGLYPLRFSVEARNRQADSTEVWEKTYFLRVRE